MISWLWSRWTALCPLTSLRCIRVSEGVVYDEEVLRACEESKLKPSELGLPCEIALWIDPLEVCARWVTLCYSHVHRRTHTVRQWHTQSQKAEEEGFHSSFIVQSALWRYHIYHHDACVVRTCPLCDDSSSYGRRRVRKWGSDPEGDFYCSGLNHGHSDYW